MTPAAWGTNVCRDFQNGSYKLFDSDSETLILSFFAEKILVFL